ncbi:hypothetical protein SFRURICE_003332, partial [Spodoptera frugiperda]
MYPNPTSDPRCARSTGPTTSRLLQDSVWHSYRDSLTDAFGDSKDNGDYRKSPAPEDDMLSAGGAHQRPSDSLLKICLSSFSSDQIDEAKTLLFESLPDEHRKKVRKGQGKENRDLMDIISLFKIVDSDVMPVFVARDLEKLPPITFDHLDVSKLLKDLILVQSEIKNMKSSFVTITQLEEEVKSQLQNMNHTVPSFSIRNVNLKRGGACVYQGRDSGPMGLSHFSDPSIRDPNNISEPGSSPIEDLNYRSMIVASDCMEARNDIPTNVKSTVDCNRLEGEGADRTVTCSTERVVEQACESSPAADNKDCKQLINSNKSTFANVLLYSRDNNDDNEQGWTVKRSVEGIRELCKTCDLIALQETWLLPSDISYLSSIDEEFSCTGTSAVDMSSVTESENMLPRHLSPEVAAALKSVRFIAQHIKDADKDNE